MWHAVAEPHLLSGSADGRQGGPKAGPLLRGGDDTTHRGPDHSRLCLGTQQPPLPCPPCRRGGARPAPLSPAEQAVFIQAQGRRWQSCSPAAPSHSPAFRGGMECQGKGPWEPQTTTNKLTCLPHKALLTQEKQLSETFKKHISQFKLILVKLSTEIQF